MNEFVTLDHGQSLHRKSFHFYEGWVGLCVFPRELNRTDDVFVLVSTPKGIMVFVVFCFVYVFPHRPMFYQDEGAFLLGSRPIF